MSRPSVFSAARRRHAPDRRVGRLDRVVAAPEHPLEHARVLAEAGPQQAAVLGVLAEPVDVEDLRQHRAVAAADLEPVAEVVGHVVAAERQHRERVAAQLADRALGGRRRLGAHDRAEEDAVLPVERLVHERHDGRAAAAEQERVDRHAGRVLPLGRDRRILRRGRGEARVRDAPRARRTPASSRCPASRSGARAARRSSPPTRRRRRRSSRSW